MVRASDHREQPLGDSQHRGHPRAVHPMSHPASEIFSAAIASNIARRLAAVASNEGATLRPVGLRIPGPADGADGNSHVARMRARARWHDLARRNASENIAIAQAASAALGAIAELLTRMRDVATAASLHAHHTTDLSRLQAEYEKLRAVFMRHTSTARWGRLRLTTDSLRRGAEWGHLRVSSDSAVLCFELPALVPALNLPASGVSHQADAATTMRLLTTALDRLVAMRDSFLSAQQRLRRTLDDLTKQGEVVTGAEPRLRDAAIADTLARLTTLRLLQDKETAAAAHANLRPAVVGLLVPRAD